MLALDHQRFRFEMAVQTAAIAAVETWVQAKNTDLAARRSRKATPVDQGLQDLLRRKHLTDRADRAYLDPPPGAVAAQ